MGNRVSSYSYPCTSLTEQAKKIEACFEEDYRNAGPLFPPLHHRHLDCVL